MRLVLPRKKKKKTPSRENAKGSPKIEKKLPEY